MCRAPDHRSLLTTATHHLPLTQNARKMVSKRFLRTFAIIQIKYGLPKLCHLPHYSDGSRDPTTRLLGFASYLGLGTWDPYSYWGRWHSMATHTSSVYYSMLVAIFLPCYIQYRALDTLARPWNVHLSNSAFSIHCYSLATIMSQKM